MKKFIFGILIGASIGIGGSVFANSSITANVPMTAINAMPTTMTKLVVPLSPTEIRFENLENRVTALELKINKK